MRNHPRWASEHLTDIANVELQCPRYAIGRSGHRTRMHSVAWHLLVSLKEEATLGWWDDETQRMRRISEILDDLGISSKNAPSDFWWFKIEVYRWDTSLGHRGDLCKRSDPHRYW